MKAKVCKQYGNIVRSHRHETGATQRQLAAKIGIPYQELCSIENGKRTPAAGAVEKINRELGISILETFAAGTTSEGARELLEAIFYEGGADDDEENEYEEESCR